MEVFDSSLIPFRYTNRAFGSQPFQDCEVFVYRIPPDVTEQELISMFEKYGDICSLRLVKKKTNFAFIRFTEPQAVKVAVLKWNAYEIRKNKRIFVCKSVENKSLVLGNAPRDATASNIYCFVNTYSTGLHSVHTFAPRDNKGINSGLAILRFKTRTCASIAKKTLGSMFYFMGCKQMFLEWHTPGLTWNDYECPIPTGLPAASNSAHVSEPTDFDVSNDGAGTNLSLLPRTATPEPGLDISPFTPMQDYRDRSMEMENSLWPPTFMDGPMYSGSGFILSNYTFGAIEGLGERSQFEMQSFWST